MLINIAVLSFVFLLSIQVIRNIVNKLLNKQDKSLYLLSRIGEEVDTLRYKHGHPRRGDRTHSV